MWTRYTQLKYCCLPSSWSTGPQGPSLEGCSKSHSLRVNTGAQCSHTALPIATVSVKNNKSIGLSYGEEIFWGVGSEFQNIVNIHLNFQPVDNVSTAARLAEVLFSPFSIDCWCLGFLSQSAERPMRPEPPYVAQWACRHHIGAPTVVERGTNARSATPCV